MFNGKVWRERERTKPQNPSVGRVLLIVTPTPYPQNLPCSFFWIKHFNKKSAARRLTNAGSVAELRRSVARIVQHEPHDAATIAGTPCF